MNALTIKYWDELTFREGRQEWTDLLEHSDCDHLFMSWDWHHSWWAAFKNSHSKLCIIAVYDGKTLVGLAPLYLEKATYLKKIVPVSRLQFIGKRYRGFAGIRAEYMNFIIRNKCQLDVSILIDVIFSDSRWNELVLEDMAIEKLSHTRLYSLLLERGCYRRFENKGATTYLVDCTKAFSDYLAGLGKNTRLRLYNRRKLFEQLGEVRLVNLDSSNTHKFFSIMNQWHLERWGNPAFNEHVQKFLHSFFSTAATNMSLAHSTLLEIGGRPVSAMFNILAYRCLYNIQQGYIEDFDKKISTGTLHIGYQIEAAIQNENIDTFDLLEGAGKKANYKSHLADEGAVLESTQWCRSPILKRLFALYDLYGK